MSLFSVQIRTGHAGVQGDFCDFLTKLMAQIVIVGMVALIGIRVGKRICFNLCLFFHLALLMNPIIP